MVLEPSPVRVNPPRVLSGLGAITGSMKNRENPKSCARCGISFLPASNSNRFCKVCARLNHLDYSRNYYVEHREILKAKSREYRAKHSTGFRPKECKVCHQTFTPTDNHQKYCLSCKPSVLRETYRRNGALYRARHPEKAREQQRKAMERRRDHYLAMDSLYSARTNGEARRKVFEHYSNGTFRCACCGQSEIDFLTIDHINNDGAKQRLRLFGRRNRGGVFFYRWLVKNGFPPGLAVLCMNCNLSKGKHGLCVHQAARFGVMGAGCSH